MMRMPRARHLLSRTALAACLSAGLVGSLAGLPGCTSHTGPNADASHLDPKGADGVANARADDWEKRSKDPAISADTYFAAGQLAESQELWDRAFSQYNKTLTLNHDHLPALFRLGVLYCKFHHYPEAIEVWKHYLKASGGDATGYANLGFCHELAGRFDEALSAYEAGIRRDPINAPCRVNYGLMLARRGKFNQAMREWQVVLPEPEVHYNLGSAYEHNGRREQARMEYRKALDLDPQMADARARLDALNAPGGKSMPGAPVAAAPVSPPATPTTQPVEVAMPTTAPSGSPTTMPTTAPTATADAGAADASSATTKPTTPVELAMPTTLPTTEPTAPTVSADAPTTAPVTESSAGEHGTADVSEPTPHQD